MLNHGEHEALVVFCHDHTVATCPKCSEPVKGFEIGTRRDFCPKCRADLASVLRRHLAACTWMRVQARELLERGEAVVQRAHETIKKSRELQDHADLLAREAESIRHETRDVKLGTPPGDQIASSRDTLDAVLRVLHAHNGRKYCAPCLAKAASLADANLVRRVRERARELPEVVLARDTCDTCQTVRWTFSTSPPPGLCGRPPPPKPRAEQPLRLRA